MCVAGDFGGLEDVDVDGGRSIASRLGVEDFSFTWLDSGVGRDIKE
jgi:hypothetical protein